MSGDMTTGVIARGTETTGVTFQFLPLLGTQIKGWGTLSSACEHFFELAPFSILDSEANLSFLFLSVLPLLNVT